jgi:hypothetical protein
MIEWLAKLDPRALMIGVGVVGVLLAFRSCWRPFAGCGG